jgi:hypothetical protein
MSRYLFLCCQVFNALQKLYLCCMCVYLCMFDVTLLWQLHALKSFWMIIFMKVEDPRGAFGDCPSRVDLSAQTHIFEMSPVETCISKMLYMNSISMWLIKLDFFCSAVTLIPDLCYVIFSYSFLQK